MAYNTNQDILLDSIDNNTSEALAPGSTTLLTGTKAFTGPFFAITALTDAVVDVSECNMNIKESNGSGAMQATTTNITIPKGVTLYGTFATVELDSGTAIGYAKSGITVTVEA
tara:strand:- start:462 stop:800 length:339 start_codon:yes stop_codon:yes gene_type:complete